MQYAVSRKQTLRLQKKTARTTRTLHPAPCTLHPTINQPTKYYLCPMPKELLLQVAPEVAATPVLLAGDVARKLGVPVSDICHVEVLRRSIDARQKNIKINLKVEVFFQGEPMTSEPVQMPDYPDVSNASEVIVVGAGPGGLFAALQLIELGLKPIVLERGRDVRGRRRDLRAINQEHIVDPDSNYCFGEGGAGTYSDGKLYTRSKKRGDIDRILKLFVAFGASD